MTHHPLRVSGPLMPPLRGSRSEPGRAGNSPMRHNPSKPPAPNLTVARLRASLASLEATYERTNPLETLRRWRIEATKNHVRRAPSSATRKASK